MKIVFIYESICDSALGVPYEVLSLALSLKQAGHEILCIKGSSNKSPEIYDSAVKGGLHIENYCFKDSGKLSNKLKGFAPAIAHVFCSMIPMNFFVCRTLIKLSIPYVFEPHGSLNPQIFNFRFGGKKDAFYYKLRKKIFRWTADRYVIHHSKACRALSQAEAGILQAHEKYRTFIVPYAVSDEWFAKPSFKTGVREAKKFLFLGRQDIYQKGIDLLLDAFGHLNRNGYANRYEALLAGPDLNGSIKELRAQIEKRGLNNVMCSEGLYGEAKEKAFAETDLFLSPSRFEGIPKTVREAMARGIPSLITRETNLADICNEDRSGIVASLNSRDIADSLEKYLDEKITLASASEIIKAAQKYTWSYVAQEMENVYRQVIK